MTRLFFPLLAAFAVLFNHELLLAQQQNVVARVDGKYTISFPELAQYVKDNQYYYRYNKNIVKAADAALADMIVNRLKIIDFFHRGLNKKRGLLESIMRTLNEEMIIRYFNTEFYLKHVDEEALQKAYKQFGREVTYREILFRIPRNASSVAVDSVRSFADRIKKRIDRGENFSDLARRYSQDAEAAKKGGLMPPVTWRMAVSWAGYDTVFHLPIDRPEMAESQDAFHIIKVDKIDTVAVPPYSNVKEDIRKALVEKYTVVSGNEFDRMKKKLVDERTLQWNEKGLRQLLRWSNIPHFYESGYSDTLANAISHGNNFLILKYSGGRVDLKEFLRLVKEVLTLKGAIGIKEDDFKQFILEAVRTDKIARKARELGFMKDVLNPGTKSPPLENGLIRIYNEQVIGRQIPPATEKALRAFYRANMDSMYYQLAKVNIYAVIDSNRSTVEEAKKKLAQGVGFNKLAHVIYVKTFVRKRDGTIASYLSNEPPYLGEAAFELKLNQTAGPIEYAESSGRKEYALIKCVGVRPEKQLTYGDVRKTIPEDFRIYHWIRMEKSVADQLRKEYPVVTYRDVMLRNLLPGGAAAPER